MKLSRKGKQVEEHPYRGDLYTEPLEWQGVGSRCWLGLETGGPGGKGTSVGVEK